MAESSTVSAASSPPQLHCSSNYITTVVWSRCYSQQVNTKHETGMFCVAKINSFFFLGFVFLPVCYFLKCFIYYNAPYLQQFFFLFSPFFFLSLFLTCFSAYTIPRLSARILSLLALSRADVSARACQRCCDSGSCLGRAGMLTLLQLTSVIADENK